MSTTPSLPARRPHVRAGWSARARRLVQVGAGLVLAFSVLVVVGWFAEVDPLVRLGEDRVSVKLNTAIALGCLAAALLVERRAVRLALLAVTLAIGLVVLAEYAFDFSAGIDEFLVRDWTAGAGEAHPGRPAEGTAVGVVLLAIAQLLTVLGRRTLPQVLSGLTLAMSVLVVIGYVYRTDEMSRVGGVSTMAAQTAVALVVLSVVTWMAVPRGILQWIAFGDDPGAALQRNLIPVAFLLLPLVGGLLLRGEQAGRFDSAMESALLLTIVATVLTVVGYRVGRTAFRMDQERETLLEELHRVNAQLEDRVRVRSHQLNRQRTKLALFEERDRIARDLHDRVIQRIFAAGLQVASLSRLAGKEARARGEEGSPISGSLDAVATELDLAIRELRNSIFELTSIDDHDNVEQVVRDIAARASRILGFMPRVDVSGQVAGLSPDLVAQLASVIQEGLSNVARHAQASAVEVVVTASDAELSVRITDDGIGLPEPLPRSSGINNLMSRARSLGGSATWGNGSPTGTVLVWRVPRDSLAGEVRGAPLGGVTRRLDQGTDAEAEAPGLRG
jgi:signal transduction histidine kinase